MRVYDFAKGNKLSNREAVELLERAGISVATASASIDEDQAKVAKTLFLEERNVKAAKGKLFSGNLAVADFASGLSKLFNVSIATDNVGIALRRMDLLPQELLSSEEQASAVRSLVDMGDLPIEALEKVDLNVNDPSRQKRSFALVHVPQGDTREMTRADRETLDWLGEVCAADREIRTAQEIFVPRFYEGSVGDGVLYRDPLTQFLSPSEFGRKGPHGERDANWIYASLEKLALWRENEQSFQWRSNELMIKVRAKLFSLWCAHRYCRGCHAELTDAVLRDDVKRILRGEVFLPGTAQADNSPWKEYRFPEFHPWCRDIRHARVQLEVALQDVDLDGDELTAYRSQQLVALASDVALKNVQYGVDRATVIRAFRANVAVLSRVGDHNASKP